MTLILHDTIPYDPLTPRPLPGIAPLDPDDWLLIDEAYAGQMAERVRLIAERPEAVHAMDPEALPAAQELLEFALSEIARLAPIGFERAGDQITTPDGRAVAIDRDHPLQVLGVILQDDFCILQKRGDEHVLTGAILCFPASWTLAQKVLKPLLAIHVPVESYDDNIARRVQRLFDGVRVGRPIWRFNALWYDDPALHQPRLEGDARPICRPGHPRFMRSERQAIMRLPESDAVVFSIHTYLLPEAALAV
ncbi:heme-dependent oxidative N-demethylase family protein [Shimia biformata]|uniref:heme-dependent oxidative N-demethylase family protein n=1 Tax=Shimia biformata TaxID=1294299 RepID=UPI00194E7195|nr:DUF3445 domain-containing protein [Shimia biformata]